MTNWFQREMERRRLSPFFTQDLQSRHNAIRELNPICRR